MLRELNRLPEALRAYEQTLAQHPENAVAKNGRATVLMHLKRFEEALAQISISNPVSRQDWIGYHLKGMIYLRMGDWKSARGIFAQGVTANLRPKEAGYYHTALALCELRDRRWDASLKCLEAVVVPRLQEPANVIRAHIFGASSRPRDCEASLTTLGRFPSTRVHIVAEEIRHRFLENAPRQDEQWLLAREEEMLLAA